MLLFRNRFESILNVMLLDWYCSGLHTAWFIRINRTVNSMEQLCDIRIIVFCSYISSSSGDIQAVEYRIGHGVSVDMCPSLWAGDQSRSPVISYQRTPKSLGLIKGSGFAVTVLFLLLSTQWFYPFCLVLVWCMYKYSCCISNLRN